MKELLWINFKDSQYHEQRRGGTLPQPCIHFTRKLLVSPLLTSQPEAEVRRRSIPITSSVGWQLMMAQTVMFL